MKKILLAGVALSMLGGGAFAADLPSRNNRPIAPVAQLPIFTWTGLYVGLNAGYSWSNAGPANYRGDASTFAAITASQLPFGYETKPGGFLGGAQIGYNWQVGQLVLGAETDIQYLGAKETKSVAGAGGVISSLTAEQTYLGTIRARLGFTPMDRLLVYGTGGLAYGDQKLTLSSSNPGVGAVWGGSRSETKWGWTAGVGAEYAFTNNITAKAEYLYYDLGQTTGYSGALNGAAAVARPGISAIRADTSGNILRAGVNYKF